MSSMFSYAGCLDKEKMKQVYRPGVLLLGIVWYFVLGSKVYLGWLEISFRLNPYDRVDLVHKFNMIM
jgi:hypothetical protein